jgi:hypothetical protein
LLWDVTGSFTCVLILVENLYSWKVLAAMRYGGCDQVTLHDSAATIGGQFNMTSVLQLYL